MATVTASNSLKLTGKQQNQIIKMFEGGTTKYTDIAKELKLKYVAVNKFMTKWKKQKGLLDAKRENVNPIDEVINKVQINEQADTITRSELRTLKQEVQILRKYYFEKKKEEVAVIK